MVGINGGSINVASGATSVWALIMVRSTVASLSGSWAGEPSPTATSPTSRSAPSRATYAGRPGLAARTCSSTTTASMAMSGACSTNAVR